MTGFCAFCVSESLLFVLSDSDVVEALRNQTRCFV